MLDEKRTKLQNLAFWDKKTKFAIWMESGQLITKNVKMLKNLIFLGNNYQIPSHWTESMDA